MQYLLCREKKKVKRKSTQN